MKVGLPLASEEWAGEGLMPSVTLVDWMQFKV